VPPAKGGIEVRKMTPEPDNGFEFTSGSDQRIFLDQIAHDAIKISGVQK